MSCDSRFFAELAVSENESAVIFDDPVCSLDHLNRKKIADLLREEAKNRQVIIFTHDPIFLSFFKKDKREEYRLIARHKEKNIAGYCHNKVSINKKNIPERLKELEEQLEKNKESYKPDGEPSLEWEAFVLEISHKLRITCELAVESILNQVISRFRNRD